MENKHFNGCPSIYSRDYTDCTCEKKRYWKLFFVALIIFIAEVYGGLKSNSNSLLADSVHVFIDFSNVIFSIIVVYLAKSAYFNEDIVRGIGKKLGLTTLLIGVFIITFEAIKKIQNPEETVGWIMFTIATIGGLGNYYMYLLLHSAPEEEKNITNRVSSLHVWSDMIMSVIVVVSSLVVWGTGWRLVDPVMSLILCVALLYNIYDIATGENDSDCGHHHHH